MLHEALDWDDSSYGTGQLRVSREFSVECTVLAEEGPQVSHLGYKQRI